MRGRRAGRRQRVRSRGALVRAHACETNEHPIRVGDVVYLVEEIHNGKCSIRARLTPIRTNGSRAPRLRGWAGETNNTSRTALGAAIVSRVSGEAWSERVLVRRIADSDARIAETVRSE